MENAFPEETGVSFNFCQAVKWTQNRFLSWWVSVIYPMWKKKSYYIYLMETVTCKPWRFPMETVHGNCCVVPKKYIMNETQATKKWRWMFGVSSFNYKTLYRTVYMMWRDLVVCEPKIFLQKRFLKPYHVTYEKA